VGGYVIRVAYFGDSITYGLGHDHHGVDITKRWTSLVDAELKKLEGKRLFFYTSNQGINGDTTRNGLERLPEVYAFRPDLITIQFGLNDCNFWLSDNGLPRVNPVSFKYNLKEMIEKFSASGIRKIILSTNQLIPVRKPMLNGKDYNENNRRYNDLVREVASETRVTLCDMERLIGRRDKSYFLDENGKWIHLSERGNRLYAEKIMPYIKEKILELKDETYTLPL